jgi:hypothetical protein
MPSVRMKFVLAFFAAAAPLAVACGSDGDGASGGATAGSAGVVGISGSGAGTSAQAGSPAQGGGAAAGNCLTVSTECTSHGQCCTGYCDDTSRTCSNALAACRAPGEACGAGPDCCTFACVDGECSSAQCTADGDACDVDGQCCGGVCDSGLCTPLNDSCRTSGNACAGNDECCSAFCLDDVCAPPSYCTQSGDICTSDAECCGGLCNKEGDASLGVCVLAPAGGAGGCLSAGEVCSAGATYDGGDLPTCGGECCSRACFPYGPTGVLICQPPSGCHPTGETCREDVDCCGSATRPDGETTQITCSKDGDNEIGRCDAGNECTPAGGICRLQTVECSANANCCSGNVLQNNTCKQDNLGIPRCLTAEVDCTDSASYVGKACASSADCCNLPCVPNAGGDPPFVCGESCVNVDGACTTTADCCSGLPCLIAPGSTSGSCGGDSGGEGGAGGGGPGSCAAYGQACSVTSDCCSGVPCRNGFCLAVVK